MDSARLGSARLNQLQSEWPRVPSRLASSDQKSRPSGGARLPFRLWRSPASATRRETHRDHRRRATAARPTDWPVTSRCSRPGTGSVNPLPLPSADGWLALPLAHSTAARPFSRFLRITATRRLRNRSSSQMC